MTVPYFYIILHKPSKRKYAGCRWGRECQPSELLHPDGYLTSSATVHQLIEEDSLSAFSVLVLKTQSQCNMHVYDYETRWLRDHQCAQSNEWLNRHNNHLPRTTVKVDQYNVYRELVCTHDSVLDAALAVNSTNPSSISACCRSWGNTRTPHGYIWVYHGTEPDWNWHSVRIKPIYIWDADGCLVGRYRHSMDAARALGCDKTVINRFLRRKHHYSYLLNKYQISHDPTCPNITISKRNRYKDDPIRCVDTAVVYESVRSAAMYIESTTGSNAKWVASNIRTAIKNNKSAYGYRWAYE